MAERGIRPVYPDLPPKAQSSKHPLTGMTDVFKGSKPVESSKLDDLRITVKPEYPFAYGDTLTFNLPPEAKTEIKDLIAYIACDLAEPMDNLIELNEFLIKLEAL